MSETPKQRKRTPTETKPEQARFPEWIFAMAGRDEELLELLFDVCSAGSLARYTIRKRGMEAHKKTLREFELGDVALDGIRTGAVAPANRKRKAAFALRKFTLAYAYARIFDYVEGRTAKSSDEEKRKPGESPSTDDGH